MARGAKENEGSRGGGGGWGVGEVVGGNEQRSVSENNGLDTFYQRESTLGFVL